MVDFTYFNSCNKTKLQARFPEHILVQNNELVISCYWRNTRVGGVVALHLPKETFRRIRRWEPVPGFTSTESDGLATALL